MFNKEKFSEILKKIYNTFDNQREFANAAGVNRGYLSRYMNMKIINPPSPKILMNIANASKGITTYEELMSICGYTIVDKELHPINNSLNSSSESSFLVVPIFVANKNILIKTKDDVMLPTNIDISKKYFGYRSSDDSMLPLLGIGDVAIVEKINTFKSGQTCLISLDNNSILIRKIIDFIDYIELHTAFPYGQPIKLTKEDIKIRNFTILGRIIKAENESAFK